MKRLLSLVLIALLLPAILAACGSAPVNTTEATTTTEVMPTTEAPTTTEEATTTTKAITTQKPTTTVTQRRDGEMTPEEWQQALERMGLKEDKNRVMYSERERTADPLADIQPYNPYSHSAINFEPPPIQMVSATVRVKFQYAGQAWMIQMWKGCYGLVLLGGEIAVLKKPTEQAAEHYWPAEESEELAISMDVYQHNFKTNSTKHLLARSTKSAWWFNGFVPGSFIEYNKKSEIIMVGRITFPNQEMLKAFEEAFTAFGFKSGIPGRDRPEEYMTDGNTLRFAWQFFDQDY